jgi:hypothetical protein
LIALDLPHDLATAHFKQLEVLELSAVREPLPQRGLCRYAGALLLADPDMLEHALLLRLADGGPDMRRGIRAIAHYQRAH